MVIKSTKIRKISTKEKEYFENYAKQIEEFCNNEQTFREAAFDQIKFILPNKSKENYLRTQLSDIKTLIYLLCNPKTGSYSNIEDGKRYNLKVDSFLQPKTWRAREQRDLDNPIIKRDNCHELQWANVKLSNVHLNDKEKEKISYIRFEDIQIFDESKKLYPCLKNFNFANLKMLLLNECGLTELSDHFLEILPLTLANMNFRWNKISYISTSISRFHNLMSLDLSINECLNDDGFPWAFMPINIEELFLRQVSITKIPAEIRRLRNLEEIQVHSKFLEFVSWKDISNSVSIIEIKGNGKINDICNLADKNNLSKLQIVNAGYIRRDN
uniref:Chaoptin n=1 Tax=Panagrolaimus sp. PS1159 TaxID=55785 RepID=A0AC35G5Q5_9BILA